VELRKKTAAAVVVCGNFPALSSIGSVVASFVRALCQLCTNCAAGGWRMEF
jgi:hypothetical protein